MRRLRRQARRYGVEAWDGTVGRLERRGPGFRAALDDGRTLDARIIVMATGASDVKPAVPRVDQATHEGSLRYCPVCDGYEVIDQRVGVLVDGAKGVHEAVYLRHFTPRVTVIRVHEETALSPELREQMQGAGIELAAGSLADLRFARAAWRSSTTRAGRASSTRSTARWE